jgi:23S rRNA (guanosine2251-2'-O)-methyltransferase
MKGRNFVNRGTAPAPRDRRIYGIHPVREWLQSRPNRLTAVHYDSRGVDRLTAVIELASSAGVSVQPSNQQTLTTLAGTPRHHGVVATALPFPYVELDTVIRSVPRLLILPDQMQDPHNLGALLRTAAATGAGAVLLPKDGSVPVTATVEAVAAGAAALVPVCRVANVARALRQLKKSGYWIVGLTPRLGIDLYQFDPPDRVVMVVGGETGMRPLVAKCSDFAVSIPMFGPTESLNASVAAAVAVYELRRRWSAEGR